MSCAAVWRGQGAGHWLSRKKARKCLQVNWTGGQGFRPSRPGLRASGESVPARIRSEPSASARQSPASDHAALTRMEQAPIGSARADSVEATQSLVRHHPAVESSRPGQRGSSRGRKLRVPGPVRLGFLKSGLAVASLWRVPIRLSRHIFAGQRMTRPVSWGTDANHAGLTLGAGRNWGY